MLTVLSSPVRTTRRRTRLLGYNAVRLPFTWKDLNMEPKNLDKDCAPVTLDFFKRRLISPHLVERYAGKPLPGNVAPLRNTKRGYCNTYLPAESGYDRLLFVTQAFISQGMYVVLDYQPMVTRRRQLMRLTTAARGLAAWGTLPSEMQA